MPMPSPVDALAEPRMNADAPDPLGMGDAGEVAALLSILIDPEEEFPQDDDNNLLNNLYYAGDEFDLDIQYPQEMRHIATTSNEHNVRPIPKYDEWRPDVVSKMNLVSVKIYKTMIF